jgi:cytoplasmic iron level regulating protein YaaA (DUF328/UPF0246 family)
VLILLPPSETKRDGGTGKPVNLSRLLGAKQQEDARTRVTEAVVDLAQNPTACAAALGLSPRQSAEIAHNAALMTSPTMPAVDRFTGVLFDALDASTLPDEGREFLGAHTAIQSACFGLIGGLDAIPAYRLSFDSRLPTLGSSLKRLWAPVGENVLAGVDDFILDMRSEGYAALAPLPPTSRATYLRVVATDSNGQTRALNHFNKKGKGEFLRALALDSPHSSGIASVDDLCGWGAEHGFTLVTSSGAETRLLVANALPEN